jgi:DNA-binding IclR family transcriptional regulator
MVSDAVVMAAPIFNHRGEVMGDVCVTMPAQRAGDGGRDRLVDAVRDCASDITARMQSSEMPLL